MHDSALKRTALFGLLGALAACGPAAPPAAAPAGAPAAPPPLAPRPLEFPGFHEARLPNGMRLLVVEHGTQPVASVNLFLGSGASADPARQVGLASLTAELLTKGTTTRDALQIAEAIEGVGGSLGAAASDDWMSVSASVLAEDLPLAFELLSDVTLRPTFPEDELETVRRQTLSGLQAALGQPGEIARRRFLREVYGETHPYGFAPVPGTIEAIRRADLEEFHRSHFSPANALLVVAGTVGASQVEELARRHFGEWSGAAAVQARPAEAPTRERTTIYLVHRPGSVQSTIWIGHTGVRPGDPDFFALQVLNQVLGVGFDSRLVQILREERGWTYGIGSRFTRPREMGYFATTTDVRTEVTDSAVAEIMTQLRRIQEERVPDDEIEAAKSYLAGSFPLRIETAGQVASQVASARLLGLPIEDVTQYPDRIRAVTAADVQRAAERNIRPGQAAIVVVGDAARVLERLEPLAPIVLYDVEGERIERAALQVGPAEDRFDGTRLQPQTLVYQLMVQGNPMGTSTEQLRRDGDAWVATSTLESPMMQQQSESRFAAADLAPLASRLTMAQGPMRMSVDLTVAEGRVRGRAEMPEQAGGARDIDAEAVEGMLLPGMDAYVIAAAELGEGRTITLPVFNAMTGAVGTVRYRVTGTEDVTVPAGSFPAYRVEVAGDQPMTVYVRQQAPHIMLRQELAGAPVTVELQEIR